MRRRLLAVWVLLVVALVSLVSLVGGPSGGGVPPAEMPFGVSLTDLAGLFGVFFILLFAALFGRNVMVLRRAARLVARASAKLARGDADGAVAEVSPLCKSRLSYPAAQAYLVLASAAERRTEIGAALTHADAGLGRLVTRAMREASADLLLPELVAIRAFALAASDRHDEASAELEALPPSYLYLDRSVLRVRLVQLVRRGDLAAAARLVEKSPPDLSLSRRDELLADVVRAAVSPERVGGVEVARIKEELRSYPEGRRWLEVVAPGALDAFQRAAHAGSDEARASRSHDDERAEREAEAEEENAADAAHPAPGAAVSRRV
jgi:hypothetical protein